MTVADLGGVNFRRFLQAAWDFVAWVFGAAGAIFVRYDFEPTRDLLVNAMLLGIALGTAQVVGGLTFQLYRGRYRIGSIDEMAALAAVVIVLAGVATALLIVASRPGIPRSLGVLAGVMALAWMMSGRLILRLSRIRRFSSPSGSRTLIYGAGDAGEQMLRLMLADRQRLFDPVGFLDDDPNKKHLRSSGVRVIGRGRDLETIADSYSVDVLVVAIPGATASFLRTLDRRCRARGVALRALPTSHELLSSDLRLADIAQVSVEDLLGRTPVTADEDLIRAFLSNKRILITGAGGSIGSEIARQVTRYNPSELVLLDRDETALQSIELQIDGQGLLRPERLVLADIRDRARIYEVFTHRRPEVVFHAAALKHLSMLESYPDEAIKTNVLGSQHVLSAAGAVDVEAFVNISTDKAANPTSVLGKSKLITERLTVTAHEAHQGRYLSVRFGNVVGSRGSVLHTFQHQIESGGPVCVTDFRATRYFMTVSEAVHLVLQAAALGSSGSTMILDMGEPVSILSVAEQLVEASSEQVAIVEVGLRKGEKLHEELVGAGELVEPTSHAQVFGVNVQALYLDLSLGEIPSDAEMKALVDLLDGQ